MTDRELLELAAKAAGIKIEGDADKLVVFPGHFEDGFSVYNDKGGSQLWNPLTDDGDALRLAVKLKIRLYLGYPVTSAEYYGDDSKPPIVASELVSATDDPYAATRRAIVRAAAEIGKGME